MSGEHTTTVTEDESKVNRPFTARCSCGWVSERVNTDKYAQVIAWAHRERYRER